jgi:hypothetical protein
MELNCNSDEIKKIFERYATCTGVSSNEDIARSIRNIERDVKYFQEVMNRSNKLSDYCFEPRLSAHGHIYNGFLHKINKIFNYYDYKFLSDYLYLYEILKVLFDGINVDNIESIIPLKEFHVVVKYYMKLEDIDEYISDFIGSSYHAEMILNAIKKEIKENEK